MSFNASYTPREGMDMKKTTITIHNKSYNIRRWTMKPYYSWRKG